MSAIVLCGDAHTAPDLAVGPFTTVEDAEEWAAQRPAHPGRYAVAMSLTPPEQVTSA